MIDSFRGLKYCKVHKYWYDVGKECPGCEKDKKINFDEKNEKKK